MARTITRANLRTEVRNLSDTVGDPNVTDTELNARINDYVQRMWNRMYIADPDRCTVVTTINTTAGTLAYDLPSDFVEVRAVDQVSGSDLIQVHKWEQGNRWKHRYTSGFLPASGGTNVVYRVMGQEIDGSEEQIHFLPDPGTGSYQVRYVQAAPALTADTGAGGTIDTVGAWNQWIAYRCARDVLRKQQRYEQEYERDIAELDGEIDAMLSQRDAAEAPQVADTRDANRYRLTAR